MFNNVTLGGLTALQKDGANELTIHFMNASLKHMGNQPMLSLRVNEYTSNEVWNKKFELIKSGMDIPVLFNDSIVMQAKKYSGIGEKIYIITP